MPAPPEKRLLINSTAARRQPFHQWFGETSQKAPVALIIRGILVKIVLRLLVPGREEERRRNKNQAAGPAAQLLAPYIRVKRGRIFRQAQWATGIRHEKLLLPSRRTTAEVS